MNFPGEYEGGLPILLTDVVNVPAAGTVQPSTQQLSCPFRVPMVIDEIRWQLSIAPVAIVHPGFAVECKLALGPRLIAPYTPVWLFGPTLQDGFDFGVLQNGADQAIISFHRWKLPKPLLVPPGLSVIASFIRPGTAIDVAGGAIVANIAYAGRLLPADLELPKRINIPYVGVFRHPIGQVVSISRETDLVNITAEPVHVQRFVGRVADPAAAEVWTDAVTMTMHDDLDRLLVPGGTPFSQAFDMNRRAWTNGQELRVNGFYRVDLAGVALTDQPQIAMIGWREEAL